MELRHLRYFVAVAEEQHFSRAAERLRVSQSPLSRQVKQLEDELGVALFEPEGRGVKLTSAGRVFLDGARATLLQAARAASDAQDAARGQIGVVRIAFEDGSAYSGLLPDIVSAFRSLHPRIKVQLLPMASSEQWRALRDGDVEIGYCYHPPDDADIQVMDIFRDRIAVVMPRAHPLAKKARLRVRDLKDVPFVMSPREASPQLYDDVISAFRARGVTLNVQQESMDDEALLTLVASGQGLTFAVESTRALFRGRTVLRPVSDLDVTMHGRAIWKESAERSPLLRTLISVTRRLRAKELPPPRPGR